MNTALISDLRALPRAAWWLFLGAFLNKFGTFVVPFFTIYTAGLGYSLSQTGLAMGAFGLGHLLAAVIGGYMADRLGRRQTIVVSMFSVAIAMLWLSQVQSLAALCLLATLTGLTGELYRPAASALLADLVPSGQRITAFAAYRLAHNAGWAFGPVTGGLLAQHSFTWLFAGDAVTSILFGLVAWVTLPKIALVQTEANDWRALALALRRDRQFWQVLLAILSASLVFMQLCCTLGLEIKACDLPSSTYGWVLSLNGLLVVLFELPITAWSRLYQPRAVMAAGFCLIGTGFMLNGIADTTGGFVIAMVVFTLGEMIAVPVSSAYVADLAPAHLRGGYMGAYGFTWAVAFVISPSMGLWIYALNPLALWLVYGSLGMLAALIMLVQWPFKPGRLNQASELPAPDSCTTTSI